MGHPKENLAGTLLLIRRSNGKSIIGNWSLCSFELPEMEDVTENMLLGAFAEQINEMYLGDEEIASVVVDGEYNPIIFFLIPSGHVGELGKHIFTFPVLTEE